MKSVCLPDLSTRPLSMEVERLMKAGAADIYRAWTERFDLWFAQPGELMMWPEIDRPYFFYNRKDWGRHPHYGRFTRLEKDRLVEMTWVTSDGAGRGGTEGAETLLRVELTPQARGTMLRLTHSGLRDEQSRQGHVDNWPEAIAILDEALAGAHSATR
jgi:uncharacterized protein YndB with AHSA1/START domain